MTDYERHLSATFRPYIDSARHIVLTSGYVIVLALTAILAFHVIGWTVCRCLRLRRAVDPSTTVVTSRRLLGQLHRHQRGGGFGLPPDSSVQTFIRSRYDDFDDDVMVDDDPDDDVSDYDDAADVVRLDVTRRAAHARTGHTGSGNNATSLVVTSSTAAASMTSPLQPNSAEFKYSETNV